VQARPCIGGSSQLQHRPVMPAAEVRTVFIPLYCSTEFRHSTGVRELDRLHLQSGHVRSICLLTSDIEGVLCMVNRTIYGSIVDSYKWCVDYLKPLFKKNSFPCTRHEGTEGEGNNALPIRNLDPGHFTTRENSRYPLNRRQDGPRSQSGRFGDENMYTYRVEWYMARRPWMVSRWAFKRRRSIRAVACTY
jgi:hypothetical protein